MTISAPWRHSWFHSVVALALWASTVGLAGCSGPASALRGGVADILMEEATNGLLIRLVGAGGNRESVSVIRSPGNWLLVTINDADVDLSRIRTLKPAGRVTKVDITLFETAVQVGFRFSEPISSFEIVEDRPRNDLLVSVFLGSQ
ncbi:MAG: hypothetical protein A2X67_09975 [Ignavibacteria bacterium GWA2_55_11]|nr:MAG: hypothetical protein A2X67_09975 [Ignavibacteria bacterium GWA2_55_11]OGU66005.1 MAG: hypothetical protein A3C56_00750 [Ignavibacteria bacterium RIFCSPHIGHO2_02_FULL_56_12]OGU73530.1 MAG: hypothetical protein A3H45_01785 [Ignavibacteria bacterium RIFCSPLOWO2_02_FULL_55_14]OGU76543.1 MAG: hypothetical protein A3G43_04440 [Ignavibacteria bacterium RIFCSPLOWO2_12_FULL_56_21]